MADLIVLSLALWIVTHTVTQEMSITANAPKPLSCQLCLSGWIMIFIGFVWEFIGYEYQMPHALAAWALAVLVEGAYQRMRVLVL